VRVPSNKKVLIAGVSGLVGYAAAKRFLTTPDWQVVGLARRRPDGLDGATLLSLDLADRDACERAVAELGDVTHLVYAALFEKPGLFQGWLERDQMERNRQMLENLFEPLERNAAGLRHVTLLQGTKAYGGHAGKHPPTPARERWPRVEHENFYFLQEDYLRGKAEGKPWRWTVLRPQIIFGEAQGSNMNPIPAIGVYAALLRERGEPLHYPGGPPTVQEAVDADLLADVIGWAADSPAAANEIFNVTNGDVFVWRHVWPAIAESLGMAVGEDRPLSLAEEMPKRQDEWAAIVAKYGLRAPVDLNAFVGQSFIYADGLMSGGRRGAAPSLPLSLSTIKLRQAGFHECMDTEDMFKKWFHYFQEQKLLPPLNA
jgi:nucleoside-diphosphate-sugar epimerase